MQTYDPARLRKLEIAARVAIGAYRVLSDRMEELREHVRIAEAACSERARRQVYQHPHTTPEADREWANRERELRAARAELAAVVTEEQRLGAESQVHNTVYHNCRDFIARHKLRPAEE